MSPDTQSCRLCGQIAPLKVSHIIPSFVFRWFKETSATGFFRSGLCPDRRQQDGPKRSLLCESCEQRLGVWERAFADNVFSTLREGQRFEPFQYGPWFGKFAVSLSWRVLLELRSHGAYTHVPSDVMPKVDEAERVWRQFLLDRREFLSPFDQHFIPLGFIEPHTGSQLPPNINRYFARSFAMDIVHSEPQTFIFTKLPFTVLIGLIRTRKPWEWVGTRIQPGSGSFGQGKRLGLPDLLHDYTTDKAVRISEINRGLSERQRARIKESVIKNPDRVASSRTFEAMAWDVDMFGQEAFGQQSEGDHPGNE
jgi:hypothetical protein